MARKGYDRRRDYARPYFPIPKAYYLKVLHLHAAPLYGGVETFLATLARERALCPAMEPIFGECFDGRLAGEMRNAGASVELVGEARYSRPWSVWQSRRTVSKSIARLNPDVAVCHMPKPVWLFGPTCRALGVPVVFYMHGPVHQPDLFDKLVQKKRFAPDLMIGVSAHTVQSGKDTFFPSVPTAVINYPQPFGPDRFALAPGARDALRAEMTTPNSDIVLVQATRMDPWKGHTDLFAALALLKDVPGWTHWLIGGAQRPDEIAYLDGLKQQAREAGIEDRIRYAGYRQDVPQFLASSDVYCQANRESEGFSLSFTEAFTAGLPIVTTNIGSASEMINEASGILPPPRDPAAFARALEALIRDPARIKVMGQSAQARIRRLSDTKQQINRVHDELARVALNQK